MFACVYVWMHILHNMYSMVYVDTYSFMYLRFFDTNLLSLCVCVCVCVADRKVRLDSKGSLSGSSSDSCSASPSTSPRQHYGETNTHQMLLSVPH